MGIAHIKFEKFWLLKIIVKYSWTDQMEIDMVNDEEFIMSMWNI